MKAFWVFLVVVFTFCATSDALDESEEALNTSSEVDIEVVPDKEVASSESEKKLSRVRRQSYYHSHNPRPYHHSYNRQYQPRPQSNSYHHSGGGPDGYGGNSYNQESGNSGSSAYGSESGNNYGSQGSHEGGSRHGRQYNDEDGGSYSEGDNHETHDDDNYEDDEGGHDDVGHDEHDD